MQEEINKFKKMEEDILNLIPHCDESQLERLNGIIPRVIAKQKELTKKQQDFIQELIDGINNQQIVGLKK